jgi:hypothetical protein
MIRNVVSRSLPVLVAGVVVLVGVGMAMAGNLPFAMQQAVSETASEVGIEVPYPSTTDLDAFRTDDTHPPAAVDRTVDVHQAIDQYKADLEIWRTCVAETARSSPGNPTSQCGPKPDLNVPRPADDPVTPERSSDQPGGKPVETGRPDEPGTSNRQGTPPNQPGNPNRP